MADPRVHIASTSDQPIPFPFGEAGVTFDLVCGHDVQSLWNWSFYDYYYVVCRVVCVVLCYANSILILVNKTKDTNYVI